LGTKKRPFGRVASLRSRALLERAAGGSANEDLSHLSNLLSARDGQSIKAGYTGSKPSVGKIPTVSRYPLLPLALLVAALAGCGGGAKSTTARPAAVTEEHGSSVAMTQACTTSGLEVWLGVGEGGAAAGSTYFPLEFTNISNRRCRLFGFPGVSAIAGGQLGSPAQRNRAHPTQQIALLPGATAHTVLQIGDVGNFAPSTCKPEDASGLRIYPPGQFTAAEIPFSFRACSAKGPIFLSVEPIQPGVGIPGG
jgi:hypothetical protein